MVPRLIRAVWPFVTKRSWRRAWKVRLIECMNPEGTNLIDPDTGEFTEGPADRERISASAAISCGSAFEPRHSHSMVPGGFEVMS